MWMSLLLAIPALLLVAGPLRRGILANWMFFLPAVAGFSFAIVMLKSVMKMNLPGFEVLGLAAFIAMVAGTEGVKILSDLFGSNKKQ